MLVDLNRRDNPSVKFPLKFPIKLYLHFYPNQDVIHLQDVAASVVLVSPAEPAQDLQDLLALQDAEQAVQQDLEANG